MLVSLNCCILSKFYIKPQHWARSVCCASVVSYRNSTSNHNTCWCSPNGEIVVSYRNSTSNHNFERENCAPKRLYLIEILHQTTTVLPPPILLCSLYLIEILHQTTTSTYTSTVLKSCILSKFYIKPQRHPFPSVRGNSCILSKFYIKPQHWRQQKTRMRVVSYRNSTSNHNFGFPCASCAGVVSYRNSTSNHNLPGCVNARLELYLIEILHQTTTGDGVPIRRLPLYLIEILHQTTTASSMSSRPVTLYLIEILHQTTTKTAFR